MVWEFTMKSNKPAWAVKLANISVRRPWLILIAATLLTVISLALSAGLELRMNYTDILPEGDPIVKSFREVQDRFGDMASLVVVLEGDYDRIIEMATVLEPKLKNAETLYNVQGRLPVDFFRKHGFALLKPDQFDRVLRMYSDPGLTGTLRGLNDDYEREYTDSESNLRRDEVDVARSILGLHRMLEILEMNLAAPDQDRTLFAGDIPSIEEAVDAVTLGEPWFLSLDRRMLLILCQPVTNQTDWDGMLATALEAENILDIVRPDFPDVAADLTGMCKIGQDEMNSIGFYTQLLSLAALILIYLLLARFFRGWIMPLLAIIPLAAGIIWTMALLYILFGGLNLFTAMMMLVLLGLGIDFSIHLISRFNEETSAGRSKPEAIAVMLSETGVAVLTGALTTAAAFLTLLIGETRGVFEFGISLGFGVLLTLLAIFFMLPSLLMVLDSRKTSAVKMSSGMPSLGSIARSGWRNPVFFPLIILILCGLSYLAKQHIAFEYDYLALEPKGLRSVELQKEIPERFGMSDHAAWLVTASVEESRKYKEEFKKKSMVGDVIAISDYIPPVERLTEYNPKIREFRENLIESTGESNPSAELSELSAEISRLWDNLDMMSNLAYMAGLDRIVKVIDGITGTQTETGEVDKGAILPVLSRKLSEGVDESRMLSTADAWEKRMRENLLSMANSSPISVDDLPEVIKRNHLPREGEGFLLHVVPRKYLFSKIELNKFAEQTSSVSANVVGSEQLIIVMFESILADGKKAALLALAVIIILVLIHFRGPIGLLSLLPLAAGALLMTGLMYVIGEKYNFMNLIAVPIILGIGIDDGIHALHRFRSEKGSGIDRVNRSFSFVGRAILLTSLTTMIGFGSIAFYTMEGMASFGRALFMGVGACFLATLFVLPPVLRIFTKRGVKE